MSLLDDIAEAAVVIKNLQAPHVLVVHPSLEETVKARVAELDLKVLKVEVITSPAMEPDRMILFRKPEVLQ